VKGSSKKMKLTAQVLINIGIKNSIAKQNSIVAK
jgi:hypothetical protein